MLYWSPILHFYQPPTQSDNTTRQIAYSSYIPFLKQLLTHPDITLTANITGSLILQLQKLGIEEFFLLTNELLQRNQLELVQSPIYHPLMPLTAPEVYMRQLVYHQELIKSQFNTSPINTVLPPELAMNKDVLTELSERGFNIIADESAFTTPNFNLPKSSVIKYKDVSVIVSSRAVTDIIRSFPYALSANRFTAWLQENAQTKRLISVNDVEVFGHHYTERLNFLFDVSKNTNIKIIKLSEMLIYNSHNSKEHLVDSFLPSSWVSGDEHSPTQSPFSLWHNTQNRLQKLYWRLADAAYDTLSNTPEPRDDVGLVYSSARKHFDRGISSCHLYWLSNWPWWNPEISTNGASELIKAIRTLPADNSTKRQAEALYAKLTQEIWEYHWSDKPSQGYTRYEAAHKQFLERIPDLEER